MFLTRQSRTTPRDPNQFPTAQLTLLAFVRVAEPIALTSIFPYAWKLVLHYHATDQSNAAFYAGILISAFSLAEALTGMYWGGLSDKVGRKPVLLLGCAGTLLSLIVVGFSSTFAMALLGRVLGGILNGNIGVIQTMVGELVTRPEHEPKAYAVMPFVWSVGTIVGPTIGGYFAEPAKNFSFISKDGIFGRYPYLLPNLVCAVLLFLAIIAGYFLLDETHPNFRNWGEDMEEQQSHPPVPTAEQSLMPAAGATAHAAGDLRTESYGTFNDVDVHQEEEWRVKASGRPGSVDSGSNDKVFSRNVVMLTVALGIFTYHSMTYDHLMPVFFQDDRVDEIKTAMNAFSGLAGGLGLSIQQCGIIMSVNGLIALFIQAVVFPAMASWMGVWRLFVFVTVGHPIAYFIVPYLALLPEEWLYPGIYACLTVRNFFSILAYPLLLILLKEACASPTHLGKINGLAASTGAACRTLASPIAGYLYGVGIAIDFTAIAWWASAFIALIGAAQLPLISRPNRHQQTTVRAAAPCRYMPVPEEHDKREVVHILVEDDGSSLEEETRGRSPTRDEVDQRV